MTCLYCIRDTRVTAKYQILNLCTLDRRVDPKMTRARHRRGYM